VKVSPETIEVIKRAQEISKLSGADLISPLVLSFNSGEKRGRGHAPEMEEVKETLNLVNFRNLENLMEESIVEKEGDGHRPWRNC
jgi:thiamine biosynthesis lipoprotein ApbE